MAVANNQRATTTTNRRAHPSCVAPVLIENNAGHPKRSIQLWQRTSGWLNRVCYVIRIEQTAAQR